MASHIAIRRDGTFEYNGERYFTAKGSDRPERDGSRYIARVRSDEPGDWEIVADDFGYLGEVREFIAKAQREGWDSLAESNNDDTEG
jgi:hypothetical protein